MVLGKSTSYYVNPVWSRRYLKVGHNLVILDKRKKLEKSLLISFFIKILNRRNDTRSFLVNLT